MSKDCSRVEASETCRSIHIELHGVSAISRGARRTLNRHSELCARRPLLLPTSIGIMSTLEIEPQTFNYVSGSDDPEQQLDLYLPSGGPAISLVVFIHGGAWRTGSRKDHTDLASYLCKKGRAVAVVDYRLSVKDEKTGLPKHIHPIHAQDVNAALAFLHARQDVPSRDWIVVGHSIGAWLTLAAIICSETRAGNSKYPAPMPVPEMKVVDCIKTCVLVVSTACIPE